MARRLDPRPAGDLRYTDSGRRVRARLAGIDVADSTRALLVWEPGRPVPLYAFPRDAFRADALRPTEGAPERAHPLSAAFAVTAGDRTAEGAAWTYADLDLAEHVALDWNAMDAWFEEDDEVFVHPRDPFHRVEVRGSSRQIRVESGDTVLAESDRPVMLFETGLPTRFYLPPEDVQMELLESTATLTSCPYKGEAVYWSARVPGGLRQDLVWSYPHPLPEVDGIRDRIAFFNERVDLTVDGDLQDRPRTSWSRDEED
jgi:uncharacterized protein (DUF427 family)